MHAPLETSRQSAWLARSDGARRAAVTRPTRRMPDSHRRATTDLCRRLGRQHALNHDRVVAATAPRGAAAGRERLDALRRPQRLDLQPDTAGRALPAAAVHAASPRPDSRGAAARSAARPRRAGRSTSTPATPTDFHSSRCRAVHFTDDRVVANVLLDGVFERFHAFSNDGPTARSPGASRSAARRRLSFALRARGLRRTSSSPGTIGFLVSTRIAISLCAKARNVCLTMRSSSE